MIGNPPAGEAILARPPADRSGSRGVRNSYRIGLRRQRREPYRMFGELNPRARARAPFVSIEIALEEIRRGRMIILMDDEQRENEGDLAMAAEKATTEAINFMAKYGRGLICLPMAPERI